MRKTKPFTRFFCLLLCLLFLAGCSPAPQEEAETAAPVEDGQPSAGEEAKPEEETEPPGENAGETASEPAPTPAPKSVRLSSGEVPGNIEELTAVVTAEDLPLLEQLPALKTLDARGSACREELAAWALEHPEVSVRCEVTLPDGTELPADTRQVDLSETPEAGYLLPLALLPDLETVELGSCGDAAESNLDWEALAAVERACPQAEFHYSFTLYGKSFDLQSTEMDLNHRTMTDEGALVKKVAACLPGLTLLDMDFCEVSDEAMAEIRDSLPNTEVVWRVWFGNGRQNGYSVRTNVTTILASNPDRGGPMDPEHSASLKYCTRVRYLDLGHNHEMTDISFVSYMPDLEVAILAIGGVSDISPLANCPHLEFLELEESAISDVRPLANLTELRYLNLCKNYTLTDITPLYGLTGLERLWLGMCVPVPQEQVEEMLRCAPNCEINTTTEASVGEGWRFVGTDAQGHGILHPRYALLYKQFDYGSAPYCYAYLTNDPLYNPHD